MIPKCSSSSSSPELASHHSFKGKALLNKVLSSGDASSYHGLSPRTRLLLTKKKSTSSDRSTDPLTSISSNSQGQGLSPTARLLLAKKKNAFEREKANKLGRSASTTLLEVASPLTPSTRELLNSSFLETATPPLNADERRKAFSSKYSSSIPVSNYDSTNDVTSKEKIDPTCSSPTKKTSKSIQNKEITRERNKENQNKSYYFDDSLIDSEEENDCFSTSGNAIQLDQSYRNSFDENGSFRLSNPANYQNNSNVFETTFLVDSPPHHQLWNKKSLATKSSYVGSSHSLPQTVSSKIRNEKDTDDHLNTYISPPITPFMRK